MRLDHSGLIWQTPVKPRQERGFTGPVVLPPSGWAPPTELPTLRGVKRICVDTETKDPELSELGPGVRRPGCHIVGLALAVDGGPRWYFPIRHEGGGNLDAAMVMGWAREELNAFDGEVVGAQLLYDLDFLAEEGVTFPLAKAFHDVQVAEPLLDEWRRSYSLDSLARDYLGEQKEEELLRRVAALHGWVGNKAVKRNLWRLPGDYAGAYGEGDVDLPLRILPKQLARLEEEGLTQVYEIERKLIPMLLAMRRRGVRVNVARAEEVLKGLRVKQTEALAHLKRLAGPGAEFMRPATLVKALSERGLKVPRTPKSGQPSITKAFLERHQSDELCATVAKGRRIGIVITTFMEGHILGHAINGRIHCQFHQLKGDDAGTIARLSSSDPNLQNVPARDEELAPMVRGIFEPEDGEVWERLDENQVEYRLLTNFAIGPSGEGARQRYINEPSTDFHKMAATMLKVDPEDKVKRKRVKTWNFAKVYGAGVKKLAEISGSSFADAQKLDAEYNQLMPFVEATYTRAMQWADRRGFVVTVLGRRQRFPFWEPAGNFGEGRKPMLPREQALAAYGPRVVRANTHMALNRKLQASAADIMKKAMVDAWEAGIQGALGAPLLTVHDELDLSKPRTAAGDEAVRELQRIMERCVQLKVPLICDRESGTTWGNCK